MEWRLIMKNKSLKRAYFLIWITVFIASLIILIKNISFIHREISYKSSKNGQKEDSMLVDPKTSVIEQKRDFGKENDLPAIFSGIPILNYGNDEMRGNSHNIILDTLVKEFPINQYVADEVISNNMVVRNKKTINDVLGIIDRIRNDKDGEINQDDRTSQDGKINQGDEASQDGKTSQDNKPGQVEDIDNSNELPISIIAGGVEELEGEETPKAVEATEVLGSINGEYFTLDKLLDRSFFRNNFYIIDSSTTITDKLFDPNILVKKDLRIEKDENKPQILIYHTHSQETYIDSRKGEEEDTVVGVGGVLAKVLSDYGFNVIHDKTKYDIMGKRLDRNLAYNYANDGVTKILKENPSIEVIIDVHRDAGKKRVATIEGTKTAQVMLFNGISTNTKGQPIERLPNPNLQGNLAFSLQLQLKSREAYPGYMYKNYLKSLRYNLHFRERSILAEVGTGNNTVEEAKMAMHYLGSLVNEVITNKVISNK